MLRLASRSALEVPWFQSSSIRELLECILHNTVRAGRNRLQRFAQLQFKSNKGDTKMRRTITGLIFLMVISGAASAQTTGTSPRGWGYFVGGVGATAGNGSSTGTFQVAGGGEGLVYRGLGLGAEVGYIGPFDQPGEGFGILSVNPSYHFRNASSSGRLVPFVTGGFSLGFRSGTAGGGNFGGGVQYWMKDHVGLRVEFRDHVFSSDTPHFFQFRVGLSFR